MDRMPRAFARRESHRKALNVHLLIMCVGMGTAFLANRFLTPDNFWAHWFALAWGVGFLFHLAVFARGTLATMGKKQNDDD
jgi:hypothetical protein